MPLGTVLPAMLGVHVVIGIGEAVVTVAALSALMATRPDLIGAWAPAEPTPRTARAAAGVRDAPLHDPRARRRDRARDRVLAVRVELARRAREGRRAAGLPRPRPARAGAGARPCPDYAFPGVDDARLATGLAGLAGALGVFALGAGVVVRRPPPARGMSGALAAAGIAGDPASPVHRLDARAKLLGLAGLTVVAATSPAWPLLACCAALLVVVARRRARAGARDRRPRARRPAARRARGGVAAVPARRRRRAPARAADRLRAPGLALFGTAVAKAAVGTLSAVLLAATTTVPAALDGLRRLHAPPLLVAIAGVMWRYVFVLAGEVARMRTALAARGHRPRHLLHGAATGRLAGALFLRAHARARARARRDGRARLARRPAGAGRRGAAARRPRVRRRARRPPAAAARRAGGAGMSCAVRARGLSFGYAAGATCSTGSTSTSRTASASPCSARTAPARRP